MKRTPLLISLALGLAVIGGGLWWLTHQHKAPTEIVLYGNIDLREVSLAFNGAEPVAAVLASEGDRVGRGQVLARLDTGRLTPQVDQAAAQAAAQQQVVDKLRRGSRPEEISQARANVAAALADAKDARARYERLAGLAQTSAGRALSRQELDDARSAADMAAGRLTVDQQALRLQLIGPRKEDIAQAEAQLRGDQAQLALLRRELADATLVAPMDATVRSRLVEPGEMASPQKPAFSLAITDPKWVRAYVSETDLGKVHPGMKATVTADAFPGRGFPAWVGFISPVAEFTPKTVQTTDLRTSLVYEIRVFVKDPNDDLRLGMPATVHLRLPAENGFAAMTAAGAPVVVGTNLRKHFLRKSKESVQALEGVSFEVRHGELTALVGPDGGGKTTLIRLTAGLMSADTGDLSVLGIDVRADPQAVQDRIGYMPQKFGLYEDLTVQENLDLYADMHGVPAAERRKQYPRLMDMTALGPFTKRLAGQLSGGMKQKLGLACTLVRSPDLLLLDEPTVGVDPLSRRELWEIIRGLVRDQGAPVLLSTSYLEEAAHCDHVVVLRKGKVLAQGPPGDIIALARGRTFVATPPAGEVARVTQTKVLGDPNVIDAAPEGGRIRIVRGFDATVADLAGLKLEATPARFEDGFMVLLHGDAGGAPVGSSLSRNAPCAPSVTAQEGAAPPPPSSSGQGRSESPIAPPLQAKRGGGGGSSPSCELTEGASPALQARAKPVITVRDLVKRFGAFVAVDNVSFEVREGEVFGLLGPNGAGKTTTFRMLCGLLTATGGSLEIAGVDVRRAPAAARAKIGYVAQKFSLYGQLSVAENLDFFASAYGLSGARRRERIDWAMAQFELGPVAHQLGGQLPGGYTQRLAMAAALLHEPRIVFLDEATSGADPLARRDFWRRITALAQAGVTVIVTTHFMAEAEYCDRIAILDSGRILAQGPPAEIRARGRTETLAEPTMEDAFVAIIAQARATAGQRRAA